MSERDRDTVGSLLAGIAVSLNEGLRLLTFAEKRGWGPDEFEQIRLLEEALDEAKKDFQELTPLVNGQYYYENDRKPQSLIELHDLADRTKQHIQTLRDWLRAGGPINAAWATDTIFLRRAIHLAQTRAANRIFVASHAITATNSRCLGAYLLYRRQRNPENPVQKQLEELMVCNEVGKFERLGETDVAFVCDFCDGFMVWENLREMPSTRSAPEGSQEPISATPISANPLVGGPASASDGGTATAKWQATGFTFDKGEEKTVVFAPVAIANHLPPEPGDWQAKITCPFCEDDFVYEQGDGEMERVRYGEEDGGFEDIEAFREHLEWYHSLNTSTTKSCSIM